MEAVTLGRRRAWSNADVRVASAQVELSYSQQPKPRVDMPSALVSYVTIPRAIARAALRRAFAQFRVVVLRRRVGAIRAVLPTRKVRWQPFDHERWPATGSVRAGEFKARRIVHKCARERPTGTVGVVRIDMRDEKDGHDEPVISYPRDLLDQRSQSCLRASHVVVPAAQHQE